MIACPLCDVDVSTSQLRISNDDAEDDYVPIILEEARDVRTIGTLIIPMPAVKSNNRAISNSRPKQSLRECAMGLLRQNRQAR